MEAFAMKLVPIGREKRAVKILYDLLTEREGFESISHKSMPTEWEHEAFVATHPYHAWYLIEVDGEYVGATYLSKQREIGIGIFKAHRRKGYAKQAIQMLMDKWPGRFMANINPANKKSIDLFRSLGFGLVQHTYSK